MRRATTVLVAALPAFGCATTPGAGEAARGGPILTASERVTHWPVEGETRPGIWFRFSSLGDAPDTGRLLDGLTITVDHGHRTQTLDGAAFSPLEGAPALRQTRYFYTPGSGTLFLTLELRIAGRPLFPDTHRLELNDDCWHMIDYRVRGPAPAGQPVPPPWPRTTFLTAALSTDPPLFLDVFVSGNCFRNPLPPF